jgi:hypothetical protein
MQSVRHIVGHGKCAQGPYEHTQPKETQYGSKPDREKQNAREEKIHVNEPKQWDVHLSRYNSEQNGYIFRTWGVVCVNVGIVLVDLPLLWIETAKSYTGQSIRFSKPLNDKSIDGPESVSL